MKYSRKMQSMQRAFDGSSDAGDDGIGTSRICRENKVLMSWKVLIPSYLRGYNPVIVGIIITGILTVIIISRVCGFEKRTLAAVCGAMAGLLVTAVTGIVLAKLLKVHGAIAKFTWILHKTAVDFTLLHYNHFRILR